MAWNINLIVAIMIEVYLLNQFVEEVLSKQIQNHLIYSETFPAIFLKKAIFLITWNDKDFSEILTSIQYCFCSGRPLFQEASLGTLRDTDQIFTKLIVIQLTWNCGHTRHLANFQAIYHQKQICLKHHQVKVPNSYISLV